MRKPTADQLAEFAQLKAFVIVGFEDAVTTLRLPPDDRPAAVADRMWGESPAVALRGLRIAAADVVEMLQDLHGSELAAFDARLAKAGAPAFTEMRRRTGKRSR